jgi:hypothetical protein
MTTKAVIDRFEEDKAVLLLGDESTPLVVARKALPKKAREGTWLQVEIADGRLLSAAIDAEETARAKERIAAKLAALRGGEHLKE